MVGAKISRKERNTLLGTLIVEMVITMARAGSVTPSVHWAPFPQSSPRIRDKIKIKFLFCKKDFK
jgi:hypothetical protein